MSFCGVATASQCGSGHTDALTTKNLREPQELRAIVDEYPERMLVGETEEISYYGDGDNELQMVFNFPLMSAPKLTPKVIRANQAERLAAMPPGAWPCNTLGNHDTARVYNRCGDGHHDDALARLHLALMLTLRGTPFLYNGEEIGMSDYFLADLSQFRDNVGSWVYQIALEELGAEPDQALRLANDWGRDKTHTPMQWANAPNAGFCPPDVQPWLPVNPNYAQGVNVADQVADPDSMFRFYRRLLHLRRETPALIAGEYHPLHESATNHFAFLRRTEEQTCLVILNLSNLSHNLSFDLEAKTIHPLFSNGTRQTVQDTPALLIIEPFEIYIGEVSFF